MLLLCNTLYTKTRKNKVKAVTTMPGRAGGKSTAAIAKKKKGKAKQYTDEDRAFKEKQKAEAKALKEAQAKLKGGKKGKKK